MPTTIIQSITHTSADWSALIAAQVDPDSVQPREGAVPCLSCRTPTWNVAARCDRHYVAPGAAR